MKAKSILAVALTAALPSSVLAKSCDNVLVPSYKLPKLASGWQGQLVATGLRKPRSLLVDSSGALLVLEAGKGLTRITWTDNGGTCLSVAQSKLIINDPTLNHGLTISNDGSILYVSSVQSVFAYSYNAQTGVVGTPNIVVDGMSNNDHTTRTLLMSRHRDGYLIISRGSDENFDVDALDVSTGLSQIKAFDLTNLTGTDHYDFNSQGLRLGWGLRNSVGVAEEPLTGGIWSVENSIDDITRNGVDIHQDNPGEELNFHGYLNGTSVAAQGGNFGYPSCYALWDTSGVPQVGDLQVGSQFSMNQNSTLNDTTCARDYVAPRLTLAAHTAPLDILFTPDGANALVSFHGSWDRSAPVGYTLSSIAFRNGEPVEPPTSRSAASDIMWNEALSDCPAGCFRPVGLAWSGDDANRRLFMTSDSTGEIYVLMRADGRAEGTIVTPSAATTLAQGGAGVVLPAVAAAFAAVVAAMLMA